ncbi:MAG: ribosome assembly RNA-binding protein YhbY [Burkholderiales bacterium]|nr:ribosome assembly RNA-binding protein YhbY [Burkholderiales bacterium]
MLNITPALRRRLRARAHPLQPIVFIGDKGLSDSVIEEIASSLDSHELIKVRAADGDRHERNALLMHICDRLGAAPIQHIGRVLVLYRPAPERPIPVPKHRAPRKVPRTKRQFQND